MRVRSMRCNESVRCIVECTSKHVAGTVLVLALMGCGGAVSGARKPFATESSPANPRAVQRMVEAVAASKDPARTAQTIALFREAIELDSSLWEARFDLGVVLASNGDLPGAEDQLVRALDRARDREDVAVALAEVRRRRGAMQAAAAGLEEFVVSHAEATLARSLLVVTLRDSGQHGQAIAQAREVLARKPGDAGALAELGLAHLAKGEREAAQLLAKQALDVNPTCAAGHRLAGLIELDAGNDSIAFQSFARASREDPSDTTSRLNMGAVLLRAGAFAKSIDQYRAVLAVAPDDATAEVGLAAALRGASGGKNRKMLEEAKAVLERLLVREHHSLAGNFDMAVLCSEALKDPILARRHFERFLDDAPRSHPARAEAERLMAVTQTAKPQGMP